MKGVAVRIIVCAMIVGGWLGGGEARARNPIGPIRPIGPILVETQDVVSLRAFPGAEGFGAYAKGGRGGRVYRVTTLADGGAGSLREAVEADGPRIVVFDVSGTIRLTKSLDITKPFITIAGQTAPGDGICLRDATVGVSADHVIVRFLRCRLGDQGRGGDALNISSGSHIILDHCSASWSLDEALSSSTGRPNINDITVQWCFITEALNPNDAADGPQDRDADGYTNVEEYLNSLVKWPDKSRVRGL